MNLLVRLLLLAILLSFRPVTVQAQETETGTGLLCDTAEQVEQTIKLYDSIGSHAIERVNIEANNPVACAVSSVAFVRNKTVKTVGNRQGTFDIVEIVILGALTPVGIQPVNPTVQYTTFKAKGHGI